MSSIPRSVVRKIPLRRKLLYALLLSCTAFLCIELVLRVIGIHPATELSDPYVGFAGYSPLFEAYQNEHGQTIYTTAPRKLVWFNRQTFSEQKDQQTRRIFCLGGSTTFGRPFADSTSFSGWMREFLPLVDSRFDWEVINAGGVSYASYRVANVMQELCDYSPDLFVILTGHNEFLESRTYGALTNQSAFARSFQGMLASTRSYALFSLILRPGRSKQDESTIVDRSRTVLPVEVDERLNHTLGPQDYHRDDDWQRSVLAHFELNIERMVKLAKNRGVEVMLIVPPANEKDCSPFKSEFSSQLSLDQQNEIRMYLNNAERALLERDSQHALELLQKALQIDNSYAITHYELGKCFYQLREFQNAHVAFQQALELDVCPLRATKAIREAIIRVGARFNVKVLDYDAALRAGCRAEFGHECLGEEYFLDHVHPGVSTHEMLAIQIIQQLLGQGWLKGESLESEAVKESIQRVEVEVYDRLDREEQGIALRNLAKVFHWSGKYIEAVPRARDALELIPGDPESHYVLADCLKSLGDNESALAEYDLLMQQPDEFPRAYVPFGELLVELHQWERARAILLLAVLYQPENPYANFLLGRVHLELGETEFAIESLKRADQLHPNEPRTQQLLEQALGQR
ncbi:MAG: tetratricopeptide repeat protein [Planctomycetales bacterium]|nr:tetratricopeptide repeat protein [Planctomycetales bacterium]